MRLYYNTQYRRSGRRCVGKSAVRDRWIPVWLAVDSLVFFFFSSRRRHTRSVSAFLLNRSSDLIRVRNIRALNGRFNTSITHAYSIVIGSKHITLNATGGGFLTASKQFRHGATSKSRSNTASNSTKHK